MITRHGLRDQAPVHFAPSMPSGFTGRTPPDLRSLCPSVVTHHLVTIDRDATITIFGVRQHLAARYGGDEFLIVLPATEQRPALGAGTRMAAAVARVRSPANATARMPVSVTFGAASSRPGDLPDTLLERADQALLNAKHRARASHRPKR